MSEQEMLLCKSKRFEHFPHFDNFVERGDLDVLENSVYPAYLPIEEYCTTN